MVKKKEVRMGDMTQCTQEDVSSNPWHAHKTRV